MNVSATTEGELVIEMAGITSGTMRDPEAVVVQGVDWTVTAGEFWVVSGLQGAGKGDFLMMASGLLPPTRGSLRLFGEALPSFEEGRMEQRLKIGFAFSNARLFHNLTLAENIALPMRYHGEFSDAELYERAMGLLRVAELEEFADNLPGGLGRDWQKRAGLMRALALQPELLLADNPLSGADPRHAEWWLRILAEFAHGHDWMPEKRATTVVVTADDERPWRGIATRFATLGDGRLGIEEAGKTGTEKN